MGRGARKAGLAMVYVAGLLCFFEGAARLALSSDALFKRVAGDDESPWRLGWAARHRKQGRSYYDFDVHHPTRGWALKPSVPDLDVYGGKVLDSNSRGLIR